MNLVIQEPAQSDKSIGGVSPSSTIKHNGGKNMKFILYTQPNCPHCDNMKELLKELGAEYQEKNIKLPIFRKEFFDAGFEGIPVVMNPETKDFVLGVHPDKIKALIDPQKRSFEKISLESWNKARPSDVDEGQWEEMWNNLKIPTRSTATSSGYDFAAPFGFTLSPGDSIVIPTGIKVYLHRDEELLIFPRSGQGFKFFSRLANTIAKIDSDYVDNENNEGNINIKFRNEGDKDWTVEAGDKIAQGTIYKFLLVDGDNFDEGPQRQGGMGSTDKK